MAAIGERARMPVPNREIEQQSSGSGPVVTYTLSPEEIAARYGPPNKSDQVIDRNTFAPKNQDGVTKKQPIDIPKNTAAERERRALREENAMSTLSKEQYLQLRLKGMNRTDIMKRHFKGQTPPFYRQLREWGIKEKDAEDRELDLMTPVVPKAESEPVQEVIPETEAALEVAAIVTNQDDTYTAAPESNVPAYGDPDLKLIQPRRSRRTMRIEITDTKATIEDELLAILAYVQAMRGETFTLELSLGEVKQS